VSYSVARPDEIKRIENLIPVRMHFGIQAFGVNMWAGEPGEQLMPEHEEDGGDEELYVVVAGRAAFTIGGDEIDAPEGTLVYVSPEETRKAVAAEPGTRVLAVGATRGKAFEAGDWELWMPARNAYEAKDYERAIDLARQQLVNHPGVAVLAYNLACVEALGGRPDDALEHLRQAIELRESFREFARGDDDFASIKGDPRFLAITGQADTPGARA
jgi:quercetin dioxygenase-like cupin family protein